MSGVDFHGARTMRVSIDGVVREIANPVKVNQSAKRMAHRNERRLRTRAARKRRAMSDWD